MRILLTGASGLIGSALSEFLSRSNHQIVVLRRSPEHLPGMTASWDPETGRVTLADTGSLDAVVHLAAENIGKRWTPATKRRIQESRVAGTRHLCEAVSRLSHRPKVLISASAVGIYGNRGDRWVDEEGSPGQGFLAELCRDWETSARAVEDFGIRVVCLRLGMVLSRHGGALARMLPIFKWGLGGRLGSGTQYWSWITREDVVGTIHRALIDEAMTGPVNVVSPNPVTNLEFTRAMGKALNRPAVFRVPRLVVENLFGEMGREVLLASTRVRPTKLLKGDYQFQQPDLESALQQALS